MKSIFCLLSISVSFFLPVSAMAAFSLNSVKSIECVDAAPTARMNVSLTTSNSAARRYPHTDTTIGFDYGNSGPAGGGAMSGKFTLQNDPAADGGVILLEDLAAQGTFDSSTLVLQPTARKEAFRGILDGVVELERRRTRLIEHAMNCKVVFR